MKEYITPHTVANAVRMNRLHFRRFVIVEGDKDARFYKITLTFTMPHKIAFGKGMQSLQLKSWREMSLKGPCNSCADFDYLEGRTYSSSNILLRII